MNKEQQIENANMRLLMFSLAIIVMLAIVTNFNYGGIDEMHKCKQIKGHLCSKYELEEMRKENE